MKLFAFALLDVDSAMLIADKIRKYEGDIKIGETNFSFSMISFSFCKLKKEYVADAFIKQQK